MIYYILMLLWRIVKGGKKMDKKDISKLLAFTAVVVMVLSAFSGCIGEEEPEETETPAPTVTDPNTLNVLAYGEPDQIDPATCYDARGSLIIHNLYDRLVGYNTADTKEINPRLAERWEISSDGMEYTFYLREDATFHDGSPVTADAVKYSFDRVLTMNQPPSWMMAQCMDLDSTQVVDEYTVKITLTKPYAAFLPILCYTVASIVNPDVIEANGGIVENEESEWLNLNEGGAGSGPYELVEWEPNERILLKRNDDYWRGPANLENVKVMFIPEVGTRVMYMKKGDADIATVFPETNIPDLLGADGVKIFADPSFDIMFLVLGCRGSLVHKEVRQAMCMAMDYDTIL
jgi:peptide/nickel transport system substrate-binding protein